MARPLAALWEALFPYIPRCVGCGVEKGVEAYLCPACARQLADAPAGFADGYPVFAAYRYGGLAARLVRSYKYSGSRWLAAFMAEAMMQTLMRQGVLFDCVCPVPLHSRKRRRRGFDQAALLARRVADLTGKPCVDALRRVRDTASQTTLSAAARRDNMRGAFEPVAQVSGRVLLIDDVVTTGATAAACAAALRAAGAGSVTVAAFARAEGQNI